MCILLKKFWFFGFKFKKINNFFYSKNPKKLSFFFMKSLKNYRIVGPVGVVGSIHIFGNCWENFLLISCPIFWFFGEKIRTNFCALWFSHPFPARLTMAQFFYGPPFNCSLYLANKFGRNKKDDGNLWTEMAIKNVPIF